MCSVAGVVILNPSKYKEVERKFASIIKKGEERGRDSFGIVSIRRDGSVVASRSLGRPSEHEEKLLGVFSGDTTVVVANNRAEPTTEYVNLKGEDDIQPFEGDRFVVSHNGVIANDKELEVKYSLRRKSKIDTAVIPPLLDKLWDGSLEGLVDILKEIKGSFAFVIADKKHPDRIFIAQNFKPVYMAYDHELEAIFFSSLDDFLDEDPFYPMNLRKLEPYSVVEVTNKKDIAKLTLLDKERKTKRALVIASGGLDSTVAATKLLREGYEVTLLHFNYHHKAEEKEREAVIRIARFLNVDLMEVNTDLFKLVGGTTLLKGGGEIVKDRSGMEGAEFAHEWVPARNLIFLSVALAIAETKGFDYLATGINLEESGAYPDNEMEFNRLFDRLSPYATGPNKTVKVLMPVGNLMKREIVKLGVEIGAPLHLTWSCYEGKERHCGRCGPCFMRKEAFRINGLLDPVEYDE